MSFIFFYFFSNPFLPTSYFLFLPTFTHCSWFYSFHPFLTSILFAFVLSHSCFYSTTVVLFRSYTAPIFTLVFLVLLRLCLVAAFFSLSASRSVQIPALFLSPLFVVLFFHYCLLFLLTLYFFFHVWPRAPAGYLGSSWISLARFFIYFFNFFSYIFSGFLRL